jgi:hypothetical protein
VLIEWLNVGQIVIGRARQPDPVEDVSVAPYNPHNTNDLIDIEYRIEDRIEEHSEDVQFKQSVLDETYNHRIGVERTNDAVKDCGLEHVHARRQVSLTLCLQLVIAITNCERGTDPGRDKLTP